MIVAKHRNGPTDAVKLSFLKRYAKFADLGAGIFLCRRGHAIRIVRSLPENRSESAAVEAA